MTRPTTSGAAETEPVERGAVGDSARVPLSRDRIIDEALALTDEEGLGGLSMRKLAGRLGVEAMSLYNHVASKHDLVTAMVDRTLREVALPPPDEPWEQVIRRGITSLYQTLTAHPAAAMTLADYFPNDPAVFLLTERLLAALAEAGLGPEEQVSAFRGLLNMVSGFVRTHTLSFSKARQEPNWAWDGDCTVVTDRQFPRATDLGPVFQAVRPEADFEFMLEAFLTALRTRTATTASDAG